MRMPASLSFRLTLLYLGLFTSSVLLLGGAYYLTSVRAPMRAVEKRVEGEAGDLAEIYLLQGRSALIDRLDARARANAGRMPFHAFIAPDGTVLTANLTSWPRAHSDAWLRLEADIYADGDETDHEPLTRDLMFADGARLLVGRDIEDIDEIEEKLLAAVAGLLTGTVILGVLGGVLMSLAIGRRISAVTRIARRVMDGDLSGRIPMRGTSDDFDRLNETLNAMLARIERLLESVRRVSDNVAHELRTPLARLRASLEELRDTREAPGPSQIDSAIAESEALEKTFDAVLRIARIESGRHGAAAVPVDIPAVVADAAELYAPAAEDREQSLELSLQHGLTVPGDRDLLFQSVCNLLDNAIKYTPAGGRILVTVRAAGARVEILVSDNGPGISPEHLPHVTERFYRVPTTAGAPGAGLGLSFIAAVAELHLSTLEFEDGHPGLTVRWSFPA